MKVHISHTLLGWAWQLETTDGQVYFGLSQNFGQMWDRIFHLNSLVIELEAN